MAVRFVNYRDEPCALPAGDTPVPLRHDDRDIAVKISGRQHARFPKKWHSSCPSDALQVGKSVWAQAFPSGLETRGHNNGGQALLLTRRCTLSEDICPRRFSCERHPKRPLFRGIAGACVDELLTFVCRRCQLQSPEASWPAPSRSERRCGRYPPSHCLAYEPGAAWSSEAMPGVVSNVELHMTGRRFAAGRSPRTCHAPDCSLTGT